MRVYPVPRAVRARFEFAPGFGLAELAAVAAGGVVGFLWQGLWALCRVPGPAGFGGRVFCFSLPPAGLFLLCRPDAAGRSLYGQLRAARAWARRPRRYLYRREDHREGWGR